MKKLKKLFVAILLIISVTIASGCSLPDKLFKYANEQGLNTSINTQDLLPEDGKNGVDGQDGKNGDSIDLYEIYQQIVELGEFSGSFSEFVKEYLQTQDSVYATNSALNSIVSIYSGFETTISYRETLSTSNTFTTKGYGAGSGVIYRINKETGDALIITNYHVVYDNGSDQKIANEISLFLYGQEDFDIQTTDYVYDFYGNQYAYQNIVGAKKISATYLGGSMLYDIAVLKVTGSEILKQSSATNAYFADSNEIAVGENAIAIGNPSGSGISATQGIISVDSEYISMTGVDNQTICTFRVIRTDAPVNPGNSGGGLFNSNGELIGIVNAKITSSSIENIAYAIPSNIASAIADNIIRNCDGETKLTVKRCVLGINVGVLSSSAVYNQATLKTEIIETVNIANINDDSLMKGVLEVGDIVESITINYTNGTSITKKITRTFHMVDLSLTLSVGDTMTIVRTASNGDSKPNVEITFTNDHVIEFN